MSFAGKNIDGIFVSPDYQEAADTLERQAAEIERLRKAAKAFESAVTTDIPAGPGYAEWVAKAQQARAALRAALTGEDPGTARAG